MTTAQRSPMPSLAALARTLVSAPRTLRATRFFAFDPTGKMVESFAWEGDAFVELPPRPLAHFSLPVQASDMLLRCPLGCCAARSLPGNGLAVTETEPNAQPFPQLPEAAELLLNAYAREVEHYRQAEVLREKVHFNETIVRSMSSGFLVLLPDMTVTHANPAACDLLNTDEQTLVGAKLSEFILSELVVRQVFVTGKPLYDEEVFIKLPNRTLHILKTCVPVFDDAGNVIAVLDHFREIREARQLISRMSGTRARFTFRDIIHASPSMAEAIELGKMAATSSLSILISGESGTGKELFAHAIHHAGPRSNAPFVVIDCASMPRELIASELFGYMEGAFTGAKRGGMPGKFELANGGTVFLDELGELPLELQPQLLRVLQSRQVTRLGGVDPLPVDIRIIAATNRDLHEEVRRGNFREDLFYRLNVLTIQVPPLRSRPEDILPLAEHFLRTYRVKAGRADVEFAPSALQALTEHPWPGNARELENAIARAVHTCHGLIQAEHIRPAGLTIKGITRAVAPAMTTSLRELELEACKNALAACNGNITRAARMLGVARSTIYKRMAELREDPQGAAVQGSIRA